MDTLRRNGEIKVLDNISAKGETNHRINYTSSEGNSASRRIYEYMMSGRNMDNLLVIKAVTNPNSQERKISSGEIRGGENVLVTTQGMSDFEQIARDRQLPATLFQEMKYFLTQDKRLNYPEKGLPSKDFTDKTIELFSRSSRLNILNSIANLNPDKSKTFNDLIELYRQFEANKEWYLKKIEEDTKKDIIYNPGEYTAASFENVVLENSVRGFLDDKNRKGEYNYAFSRAEGMFQEPLENLYDINTLNRMNEERIPQSRVGRVWRGVSGKKVLEANNQQKEKYLNDPIGIKTQISVSYHR